MDRRAFRQEGGAYSSEDMTDDATAVMDAFGWERARAQSRQIGARFTFMPKVEC
jgi:hypothetical protein